MMKPKAIAEMIIGGEAPLAVLQSVYVIPQHKGETIPVSDPDRVQYVKEQLAMEIGRNLLKEGLLEFEEEQGWSPITRMPLNKITARLTAIDPVKYKKHIKRIEQLEKDEDTPDIRKGQKRPLFTPVGQTFIHALQTFKVVENERPSCQKGEQVCAFFRKGCAFIEEECRGWQREDGKHVIFIKEGRAKKKKEGGNEK